jgi:hypothetical protein
MPKKKTSLTPAPKQRNMVVPIIIVLFIILLALLYYQGSPSANVVWGD